MKWSDEVTWVTVCVCIPLVVAGIVIAKAVEVFQPLVEALVSK